VGRVNICSNVCAKYQAFRLGLGGVTSSAKGSGTRWWFSNQSDLLSIAKRNLQ
jgi:hypothetical protein